MNVVTLSRVRKDEKERELHFTLPSWTSSSSFHHSLQKER